MKRGSSLRALRKRKEENNDKEIKKEKNQYHCWSGDHGDTHWFKSEVGSSLLGVGVRGAGDEKCVSVGMTDRFSGS